MRPAPDRAAGGRPLSMFFVLVTVLSVPFWGLGAWFDSTGEAPIGLPVSALMFVCPVVAASVLVHCREGRAGVVRLLKRAADCSRAPRRDRYLVAAGFMPVVAVTAWVIAGLSGAAVGRLPMPLATVPVLSVVFLIAAAAEELGWTGYATDPMLRRWGELNTGVALGVFWGAWHLVPLVQAHHGALWISGWFATTVAVRVVMVRLYLSTGRSVLSAIFAHASLNVCAAMTPGYGLDHMSLITGGLMVLMALFVADRARRVEASW
ncbi:CPBP family intramembrane metalloprotease [Streptomyces sp. JV185]|uniref:CPBP family intramembrane glutamic endopeptidase n=1 Tax=Streptomyces sp. JV185 TaxID=858638 RepID=UPI002E78768E|nr:CPBP family intramembrane glutamic endopeptidase [Streptomyces sp. JV185]MEE1773448.1 CPBP family intramembrane metalloprotease [Streptomyces sp. JV185]